MKTRVLILAAGQGTRLRPLTNNKPKCLVPLAGKSLLQRQVKTLKDNDITNIHIATGFCADQIKELGFETSLNPRFAETNMVETNIGVIKDNIDKAVNGDKSVDVDSTEEEVEVTDTAETTEDKSGGGKKIQIDDFKFINSHVIFAVHLKESGTQESVLLPDVIITDIGADSPDGATVSEISGIVINELYIAILKAAKGVTSENFNKSVNKGIEKIKEGTKEMIKGVKNIFGSDE